MKQIYVVVASLIGMGAFAQSGVISGKIIDAQDNLSLPGASIKVENSNRYTISDQNGGYQFLDLPEGTYSVYVEYIGYVSETQEVVVDKNKTTHLTFSLSPASNEMEEMVIIGNFLSGQAKALNKQKNNQNITNVISSDQVGRFPDANIGDALKRVSGITMQNDQGEARNIIIRGLAPNLNSVTINGDRIPSAEGDNRNVQMDLIPSDMISTIEVNKTLTPDMDADAIGGSVNLITRANPNGERISATLAGGYAPIRDKGNYTAGLVYGNRYLNDKLGAVFSASYNNNNFGSDNIEAVWSLGNKDQAYISEFDIRKYDVQRIRTSFALALDYEFNDNNKIYANAMYNQRYDRENRYRVRYRDIEALYDADDNITGFEGSIRRETKGGIDNNKNKNTRLENQKVQNYALGGEHLLSSKIDLDWSVNYATASEDRPNERYIDFQLKDVAMQQNPNDTNNPLVTSEADVPERFTLRKITENHNFTEEKELGAKINIRFPFSVIENQKGRIRTGLRTRIKDKERNNIFYEYKPVDAMGNLSQITNNFYSGKGWQQGSQYVPGYFADNQYLGGLDLKNPNKFEEEAAPGEFLAVNYKAKEKIYAGYVRWDQDFSDRLSMITGVRIENTEIDYTGNYVVNEEDLEGQVTTTNSYTNVLPSLAFKFNVQDDFILRAAFSTALARPNYYALAPFVNALPDDTQISAGNPDLKATYAYNYDFMAEKYFQSIGIVSGGVFYKRLNNFIYNHRDNLYNNAKFANDFPGIANPIPVGEQWRFVQSRNGKHVNVYGFEVAVQRQLDFIPGAFFKGLGVYLNYTYTKSEAKGITNSEGEERTDVGLPGTAPHMFNASLSWENKKFSARVSLNYASDYIDELGGTAFEDRYYDKQTFVDANASYKITNNFRIFLEANNLTNQPLRYYQGISSRTMQSEYYQGRFNLGVKLDF